MPVSEEEIDEMSNRLVSTLNTLVDTIDNLQRVEPVPPVARKIKGVKYIRADIVKETGR